MLFKILQGNEANLPSTLTDGYCYYLRDKHYFYVDHKDPNGTLVRSKLSAEFADKLRYVADGQTIEIDPAEIALKSEMLRKVELTQDEYDALPEKDPNVLYIITDAEDANYVSEDMIGIAGGIASLDTTGKVPTTQIPNTNRQVFIDMLAAAWTEEDGKFNQTVSVSTGLTNTFVSLQPTPEQIIALQGDGVSALQVNNKDGVFTAVAIGAAPTTDLSIQGILTEVKV